MLSHRTPAIAPPAAPQHDWADDLTNAIFSAVGRTTDARAVIAQQLRELWKLASADLRATLEEVESYFEDRADVDDGRNGRPSPNTEMSILTEIRRTLGKAR